MAMESSNKIKMAQNMKANGNKIKWEDKELRKLTTVRLKFKELLMEKILWMAKDKKNGKTLDTNSKKFIHISKLRLKKYSYIEET
jgi:hypothetical protein